MGRYPENWTYLKHLWPGFVTELRKLERGIRKAIEKQNCRLLNNKNWSSSYKTITPWRWKLDITSADDYINILIPSNLFFQHCFHIAIAKHHCWWPRNFSGHFHHWAFDNSRCIDSPTRHVQGPEQHSTIQKSTWRDWEEVNSNPRVVNPWYPFYTTWNLLIQVQLCCGIFTSKRHWTWKVHLLGWKSTQSLH